MMTATRGDLDDAEELFDGLVRDVTHPLLYEIDSQILLFAEHNIVPQHVLIVTEAIAEISAGLDNRMETQENICLLTRAHPAVNSR